jgi:hypothetical protein
MFGQTSASDSARQIAEDQENAASVLERRVGITDHDRGRIKEKRLCPCFRREWFLLDVLRHGNTPLKEAKAGTTAH